MIHLINKSVGGILIILLWMSSLQSRAQSDFNMAQFQNTPLLTNPGMVAMDNDIRLFLNYRNQPNATEENFITTMITGVYPLINRKKGKRWGGIGAAFLNDKSGQFLKTNGGLASFAYNVGISQGKHGNSFLSLGIQGGYIQRSVSIDGLTTSSQFLTGDINEVLTQDSQGYGTIGTGLMWYLNNDQGDNKAFLGVSGYNLNHPETAFFHENSAQVDTKLPHHFTITGGLKVLHTNLLSLTPNFRWLSRSGNDEINAGAWLHYTLHRSEKLLKEGNVGIGMWYNFNNAFVGGIQLNQPRYFATMSFDLPTANTSDVWQGTNVFEITIGLRFARKPYKRPNWQAEPVQGIYHFPKPQKNFTVANIEPIPIPPVPRKRPKTKPGLEDGAFRFKFNSDELDERSKALLDSVSQVLMEYPEAIIDISGHTCDIGDAGKNLRLSKRRAEAVKKYLSEYDGIDPKRVLTSAYGEERPLVPNLNETNRRKNRRVAFKMRFPE